MPRNWQDAHRPTHPTAFMWHPSRKARLAGRPCRAAHPGHPPGRTVRHGELFDTTAERSAPSGSWL